ncbi:acyl-CoA thioesterase [Cyanobium sp. ATX 6A2]|uniref:acyl-CoA thioesterase n=1 Tax=Cyanobium sp. ATX 6A2 TaxID=2823700 RepID=UPI0020CB7B1E|nr:acyl-CoA thioesterase [Cyanobium sp. ATX 6A2]MCP9888001.1 acyl-CoA thioesterase [Cyanobium sp. ATX 6A2]
MQTVTECGEWLLQRRVLPQHTDHAGVMWHGSYLAWLEEARVEALAAAGLAYSELSAQGLELPVVSLTIQYRQALVHGDAVELRSAVLPRQGVKLPWLSRFYGPSGQLAASARVELVLVDRRGQQAGAGGPGSGRVLRRWPQDLARAVESLQRGPG